MAIEPLSKTAQVQPRQQSKPIKVTEKETQVSKPDSIPALAEAAPDVVSKPEAKENDSAREPGQASKEQLKQAVDKINKNMNNSMVEFGIHESTHRITIKILDKETKEIIRELPPEQTLDMIAKVWEMAGILVDEKR